MQWVWGHTPYKGKSRASFDSHVAAVNVNVYNYTCTLTAAICGFQRKNFAFFLLGI